MKNNQHEKMTGIMDDQVLKSIVSCIPEHIAVIDEEGVIVFVNDPWKRFWVENDGPDPDRDWNGLSYLEALYKSGDKAVKKVAAGIIQVIRGEKSGFQVDYPCHAPDHKRWYRMHVARLDYEGSLTLVSHTSITDVMLANQELLDEKNQQRILIEQLHEVRDQLLQSEKMASIGQLAAGVAHEINNPVGYINSNIGSLKRYIDDLLQLHGFYEELESHSKQTALLEKLNKLKQELDIDYIKEDIQSLLEESEEGVSRVRKIVQDLKDFSHVDEAEWQWSDVHRGLDSTLNVVWNELKYKSEVHKHYGDIPLIECMPSQLNQVFMNILVNAAQAIDERGEITISTGMVNEQKIWIEIKDTGNGIDESSIHRIFEPFYTTKPVGAGTGLGLSVSYNIINNHHGKIDVTSSSGEGTCFRIVLPVSQTGSHN